MNFLQAKVFRRVFFMYSLVIIISILTLSAFITEITIRTIKNNQVFLSQKVIENVNNTFQKQADSSKDIINLLYSKSSALNDTINFLTLDYEDYIKKRLDLYYYYNNEVPYYSINTYVKNCFSQHSNIDSIVFYSYKKDTFYLFYPSGGSKIIYEISKKITIDSEDKNINLYLIEMLKKLTDGNIERKNYTINDIRDSYTLNSVGSIIVSYRLDSLDEIMKSYEQSKSNILVIDKEGDVLYDSKKKYINSKYPYLDRLRTTDKMVYLDQYCYVDITTNTSGILVVSILPVKDLVYANRVAIITILFVAALIITIGEILAFYKMRSLSNRIYNINLAMKQVQSGEFKTRIKIDKEDDEISMISQSFNDMCKKLEDYINRVYLMEIKQKNAEMTALQSKINPHFLYNTLESIRMKSVSNGDKDVSKMLYNLATLFRNMIKGKTLITIEEELAHCELYLELFKFRYDNRFDFCIDVEQDLLNREIIKFTIQPIIENFIVHGVRLERDDNFLIVSVEKEESNIVIVVEDNGKGIDCETTKKLNSRLNKNDFNSDSIGLINVHERIQIQYGKQYGLSIEEKETAGVRVVIKIPIKEVDINV